jgi:hypothetical protein
MTHSILHACVSPTPNLPMGASDGRGELVRTIHVERDMVNMPMIFSRTDGPRLNIPATNMACQPKSATAST